MLALWYDIYIYMSLGFKRLVRYGDRQNSEDYGEDDITLNSVCSLQVLTA